MPVENVSAVVRNIIEFGEAESGMLSDSFFTARCSRGVPSGRRRRMSTKSSSSSDDDEARRWLTVFSEFDVYY